MVKILSNYVYTEVNCSVAALDVEGRTGEKRPLVGKVASLHQRINQYGQEIDQIQQEGVEKHDIVVLQQEIEKKLTPLKEDQRKKIGQNSPQIQQKVQQDQLQIRSSSSITTQISNHRFSEDRKLREAQKELHLKLSGLEHRQQELDQKNIPLIQQNLDEARVEMRGVQSKVHFIQETHQRIEEEAAIIGKKKEEILQQMSQISLQKEAMLSFKGTNISQNDQTNSQNSFLYSWLKKIQDFYLSIFDFLFDLNFRIYSLLCSSL